MKNSFGNYVSVTLFGESHGSEIGCVIDSVAPGIEINEDEIALALAQRRPSGDYSTARRESDPFRIVSGVKDGFTEGTPLALLIPNSDQHSADYPDDAPARPGHADFAAREKYHGFEDRRGGGHFSGRLTAALVAAGAILNSALRQKGIVIGTHILRLAGLSDRPFSDPEREIPRLMNTPFPLLDETKREAMTAAILAAKEEGDSVGGILETCVVGMPSGVGEPWFDSMESCLAHALFSIPAVKGVQFGLGFGVADRKGSEVNDAFFVENNTVKTRTNHNGGINGGITNGMPLVFSLAVKPTPTIRRPQESVRIDSLESVTVASGGRHDPCIVHRAASVVNAVTAIVLYDSLTGRYGTDWFTEQ